MDRRSRAKWPRRHDDALVRSVVEHATDVLVVMDERAVCRFASASTRDVLGYDPSQLVGRNLLEIVHRHDREEASAALARSRVADPGALPRKHLPQAESARGESSPQHRRGGRAVERASLEN